MQVERERKKAQGAFVASRIDAALCVLSKETAWSMTKSRSFYSLSLQKGEALCENRIRMSARNRWEIADF